MAGAATYVGHELTAARFPRALPRRKKEASLSDAKPAKHVAPTSAKTVNFLDILYPFRGKLDDSRILILDDERHAHVFKVVKAELQS